MRMIREAADAASRVYARHWLRHWTMAHHERLQRVKTNWARTASITGLFNDIETIMKDIPQHEG